MSEGQTQLVVSRQYGAATKSLASRSDDPYGLRLSGRYHSTSGAVISLPLNVFAGVAHPHDNDRPLKINKAIGKSGELREMNEAGMVDWNSTTEGDFLFLLVSIILLQI